MSADASTHPAAPPARPLGCPRARPRSCLPSPAADRPGQPLLLDQRGGWPAALPALWPLPVVRAPPGPRCPTACPTTSPPRRSAAGPPSCPSPATSSSGSRAASPTSSAWWPSTSRTSVRLTTNLVDVELDAGHDGMPVEVVFEHDEDVYLPLFRPVTDDGGVSHDRGRAPLERRAVISGIGQSADGPAPGPDRHRPHRRGLPRRGGRRRPHPRRHRRPRHLPGDGGGHARVRRAGTPEVQDALRLRLNWHDGGGEGRRPDARPHRRLPGGGGRPGPPRARLPHGVRVDGPGPGGRQGIGGSGGGGGGYPAFSGFLQWSLPFGAVSAVNWIAQVAQRRMHEFGLTREQLGQIALNGRRNAAHNPSAIYREPMDLDDYLDARMISTPLCLFDCDAPCDGSTAFVVSHRDYAPDTPHPACHVNAVGTALRGRPSWDQFDDPTSMAARDAAASMWERTELRPSRRRRGPALRRLLHPGHGLAGGPRASAAGGRAGPSSAGGTAIGRAGVLPLNTAGGQLSGGRLHGFGLIHEACVQLRGEGGERQVYRRGHLAARGGRGQQRGRPDRRHAAPHPAASPR